MFLIPRLGIQGRATPVLSPLRALHDLLTYLPTQQHT